MVNQDYQSLCDTEFNSKNLKTSMQLKNQNRKTEMKQHKANNNIYKILHKNHSFRNLNELLSFADRSKSFHDIKKGSRLAFNKNESIDIANYSRVNYGTSTQMKSFSPSNKDKLNNDKQYFSLCDNVTNDFKLPMLSKDQENIEGKNILKMQIKGNLRMSMYTNQYGELPTKFKKSEIYK